jgi:multisubunit Na+/H+ antiporter MnhF subunit
MTRVPDRSGRLAGWLAWFAVLNVLWLVLISAWVLEEELLGLLAAAVGATAAEAVREQGLAGFRLRPRWLLRARVLPWRAVRETGLVLAVLVRRLTGRAPAQGRFRVVPVALPADKHEQAAKRALLTAGEVVRAERLRADDRHARGADADPRAGPGGERMTAYFAAAAVLLAALAPLIVFSLRASPADGLVALNLGGTIATLVLLLVAEATERQSFFDLAVVSAVLSFAGGLAYARFLERWL